MAVPPTDHTPDAMAAKALLRREARAERVAFVATLTRDERAALEAAVADVLDTHLPPGATAAYTPVGSEIDPRGVARPLLLPRVTGGPLDFVATDGTVGVPAIILVPLLAVDATGTRLGQGGGHYDRTLAALRAVGPVMAIGIAWEVQRVTTLPVEPWDMPLDALATPSGWYDFTRR